MNKADMVKNIASMHGDLKESDIKIIIDSFFDNIKNELVKGKEIELRNFGSFRLTSNKTTDLYSPNLKPYIRKDAYKSINFKLSKNVFNKLNES